MSRTSFPLVLVEGYETVKYILFLHKVDDICHEFTTASGTSLRFHICQGSWVLMMITETVTLTEYCVKG